MAIHPQAKHPLAEIFGFPTGDARSAANRHRSKRLCPFNNKVPNRTKDKAQNPLGVCSVFHENDVVITCPIRFRQGWMIADDAADFFFPANATWTTLTEVRLKDADGGSAGNIDIVLCAYDKAGKVHDFGALEVQAVYISGSPPSVACCRWTQIRKNCGPIRRRPFAFSHFCFLLSAFP